MEATEQDVNFIIFVTVSFFFFSFFFWQYYQQGFLFFLFFSFWCLFIMWNFSCSMLQLPFLNTFFSSLKITKQNRKPKRWSLLLHILHLHFLFFCQQCFMMVIVIMMMMMIDIYIYTNKYIFKWWQWKVFLENEVRFGFLVNGGWSEQLNISPVQVLHLLVGVSTLCKLHCEIFFFLKKSPSTPF